MTNIDNSELANPKTTKRKRMLGIAVVVLSVAVIVAVWFDASKEGEPVQPVIQLKPEPIEQEDIAQTEPPELEVAEKVIEEYVPVVESEIQEPEVIEVPLPSLNESDGLVQEKLSSLTWRKELLKLVINEDMIRRFVVFTDNFAQGTLAYEHSPFFLPTTSFTVLEGETSNKLEQYYHWDDKSTKRFSLYVDLLRTIDVDTLAELYIEMKPLIDQAYAELGYPDDDFTEILQLAISRVLDMEIPKEPLELIRPSVMYRYKNSEIEAMDDSEKLLLRLGKDNVLVIKSVLLEINEKLSRQDHTN